MKRDFTTWYRSGLMRVLVAGALFLSPGLFGTCAHAQKHLSHNDVKKLVQSASTRQDHLRLADYYHGEALRLAKEAAEHADLEAAYANRTIYAPKSGIPGGELEHCKHFSESIGAASKEAEALSADHLSIANNMQPQSK